MTSTDASTTIQNAFNAIIASGNSGTVQFGSGKFYCDNLNIAGGIQIRGQGYIATGTTNATDLIQNGPGNILNYVGSSTEFAFAISNMEIAGSRSDYTTGSGLYIAPAGSGQFNDVHISDVFFYGFPAYGIYTTWSWGWMISNSIIEYNSANNTADYGLYLGSGVIKELYSITKS